MFSQGISFAHDRYCHPSSILPVNKGQYILQIIAIDVSIGILAGFDIDTSPS